jgi:hypothetical protein
VFGQSLAFAGEYGTPGIEGMRSETTIGLAVWVLVLLGIRATRRKSQGFWPIAAAAFLILALGPALRLSGTWLTTVPLPYLGLYVLIPPLRASRDPTRMFPMAMLMMSMIAAFGVVEIQRWARSARKATMAVVCVGAAVLFESLTPWPAKKPASSLIPAAYDAVTRDGGAGAVLDLTSDQEALLAQTRHGHPVTAGRVAIPRSANADFMSQVERDFRDARNTSRGEENNISVAHDASELDRLGIEYLVLRNGSPAQQHLAAALGFVLRTKGEGLAVYARALAPGPISRSPDASPSLRTGTRATSGAQHHQTSEVAAGP